MTAVRLIITGIVQGVGFRAAFARKAVALGLDGWVRNRRDGTVEAQLDGDEQALQEMIDWSAKGPPAARVAHVALDRELVPVAHGFRIAADE